MAFEESVKRPPEAGWRRNGRMVGIPESGRRTHLPESATQETGIEGTRCGGAMLFTMVASLPRTESATEAMEFTVGFDGYHRGFIACLSLVYTRVTPVHLLLLVNVREFQNVTVLMKFAHEVRESLVKFLTFSTRLYSSAKQVFHCHFFVFPKRIYCYIVCISFWRSCF